MDEDVEPDLLDESGQEGSGASPAAEAGAEPDGVLTTAQATKLRNENRSLRGRLRRSELSSEFGPDVAGLIPDSLPLSEWADYAAKLQALKGQTGAGESPPVASEPEAPAAPSLAEQRLAAVSATSHGTPAVEKMSALEWMALRQKDPGEADRVLRADGIASAGPPNPQTAAQQ